MEPLDNIVFNEFSSDWDGDIDNNEKEKYIKPTQCEIEEKDAPGPEHLEVLSKIFGHKNFRPFQWKIINSIMNNRRDVCAIMATGYGKSLCYQFPSVYIGGVTLVVSPLISLMEDQVLSLKVTNIPACLLGSANDKQQQTIEDILENKYSLVYCTPEFVTGDYGNNFLIRMKEALSITLIAIDEAHCVSSWGHDFRFQYRQLGVLKKMMPDVPILAVTATATQKVRNDIVTSLNLKNPLMPCTGFDRPNLYFEVHPKSVYGVYEDIKKHVMKKEDNGWCLSGSTIVYCITRKNTEEVAFELKARGINCLPYHAGLSLSKRKDTHEQFIMDKVECIVATIAFGMGIDKPDVRNVVHYGSSSSLESYYQEVGRAGRDGMPSKCVCFYADRDFHMHRMIREKGYGSEKNKAAKEIMLTKIIKYLTSSRCRRKFVLSHFEGADVSVPCHTLCCDNCTKLKNGAPEDLYEGLDSNGLYDFTEEVKIYLSTVDIMNGEHTTSLYIWFLRGSKNSKLPRKYQEHPCHGFGKHKSERWWKAFANMMAIEGFLTKQVKTSSAKYTFVVYSLSLKGKKTLSDLNNDSNLKIKLEPIPELLEMLSKKPKHVMDASLSQSSQISKLSTQPSTSQDMGSKVDIDNLNEEDTKLYRLLLDKRNHLATSNGVIPYTVATQVALAEMAKRKPKTIPELISCNLEGFAEGKIRRFGSEFVSIVRIMCGLSSEVPAYVPPLIDIKSYAKSRAERTEKFKNIPDVIDLAVLKNKNQQSPKDGSIKSLLEKNPLPNVNVSRTMIETYELLRSGKTLEEVAHIRKIKISSVISYLVTMMKTGHEIKVSELGVDDSKRVTILKAIHDVGDLQLKVIKEACGEEITYDEVKVVQTFVIIRRHLQQLNLPYEEFDADSYRDAVHCDVLESHDIVDKENTTGSQTPKFKFKKSKTPAIPSDVLTIQDNNTTKESQESASSISNFKDASDEIDLDEIDKLLEAVNDMEEFDSDATIDLSDESPPKRFKCDTTEDAIDVSEQNVKNDMTESDAKTEMKTVGNSQETSNKLKTKKLPPWMVAKKI